MNGPVLRERSIKDLRFVPPLPLSCHLLRSWLTSVPLCVCMCVGWGGGVTNRMMVVQAARTDLVLRSTLEKEWKSFISDGGFLSHAMDLETAFTMVDQALLERQPKGKGQSQPQPEVEAAVQREEGQLNSQDRYEEAMEKRENERRERVVKTALYFKESKLPGEIVELLSKGSEGYVLSFHPTLYSSSLISMG